MTVDKTAPTVTRSRRRQPHERGQHVLSRHLQRAVTGVATGDFTLPRLVCPALRSAQSPSGNTRTVTVNTGSGNGTIRLDLTMTPGNRRRRGRQLDGNLQQGTVLTIDKTAPTVSSITPTTTPTNAASILPRHLQRVGHRRCRRRLLLDHDRRHRRLNPTISGSGDTRTVTVNTGSGGGTIRLDLSSDTPAITDAAGNNLTATFNTGTVLTVDNRRRRSSSPPSRRSTLPTRRRWRLRVSVKTAWRSPWR